MDATDTIVALSSGSLPAGIAVLRISGPAALAVVARHVAKLPEPRRAVLRTIRNVDGGIVDRGLVILFPGPDSVTGEDLVELHLHGGKAVVAACLEALTMHRGVRLADAGEFTRRAFVNGRMDLTEAEGLADLLAAETELQRKLAVAQTGGTMRRACEGWMRRLTHMRAMLEADFDFSDEDDVADDVAADVSREIVTLREELEAALANARRGEILRDGFKVAIVGAPNAGKSSLVNCLAERDVAIVSDIPGTTRDRIEVTLDLGGLAIRLIDTAGLRETADPIESLGIERAMDAARHADLVLHLCPVGETADLLDVGMEGPPTWIVTTKADRSRGDLPGLAISTVSGAGIDRLVEQVRRQASEAAGNPDGSIPTRSRHRDAIGMAIGYLDECDVRTLPPEVVAELLRMASDALGRIVGKRGVEDLLDVIFSQFCIGK
ncbi:tRNA uridine-5-carboxymethylaminomethyl(34) synthesis GTPase MnmE [Aureimonas altamirensis]|uniref:tRNA uridine-5-carboxymethylaminomethyl(34) synthesis GTPase MnmE n=1 Tax=Aureimonas altamirensis TaxID=370622 RepID=UPI0020366DE3|nr:tRNA uridine-5-carboxymethylaminomethyl(34) synthesis GTPase MnmE [Aureimonas altamirensis]MCM2505753.1 tRNA uridine-5-carboxymethylaminomethyl(34) synthesis GTPase MnmE [Aureimonas altamirensis]